MFKIVNLIRVRKQRATTKTEEKKTFWKEIKPKRLFANLDSPHGYGNFQNKIIVIFTFSRVIRVSLSFLTCTKSHYRRLRAQSPFSNRMS